MCSYRLTFSPGILLVSVMQLYSSIDITTWKNSCLSSPPNPESKLYNMSRLQKFICFNQNGVLYSSLNGKPLKLVDQFIYLSSNISSTESNVNICIGKAWIAIDRLMDN